MYTARVPMEEMFSNEEFQLGKVMKPFFAESGGKECYVLNGNLVVHFDEEADLVAWTLRWSPAAIKETYIDQIMEMMEASELLTTAGFKRGIRARLEGQI
jgi:hypothetical protein